jgi:CubicO group peptidase (beta-lactamase class C family)
MLLLLSSGGRAEEEPNVPRSKEELRQSIEAVLMETGTPGAGVVLVSKDDILWSAGIGIADRATGKKVTAETMFRAGSISKSFVAVAILKLQEEGKLQIDDRLSDLVGGELFDNPWEDQEPLRLVHLLEHTAGFDDFSLRQFATSAPDISPRDSLAFDPRPRRCRWRPGRFFSYSNAGYDLAGHAIERVTGRDFDSYIEDEILRPLGMTSASFLLTERAQDKLATGYLSDGVTESPYWHIVGRPAGSLNVSPSELARFVQLLLNRGTRDGVRLLSDESVERMERPASSLPARRGMRAGYGMGNSTTCYNGHLFHGHGGGLPNFLALYGYAPQHGVGFTLMINSGNFITLQRLEKLILGYLTKDVSRQTPGSIASAGQEAARLIGFYEPCTPRHEFGRFLERLVGVCYVSANGNGLTIRGLLDSPRTAEPGEAHGMFHEKDDAIDTILFAEEDDDIFMTVAGFGMGNFRRIPSWHIWLQGGLVGYCAIAMASAVAFPLIWLPRKFFGRMRGVRHFSVRVLPLAAVLSIGAAFGFAMIAAGDQAIERLGRPTAWSVGFCMLTWLFAVLAIAGFAQAIRSRQWDVNRWVRRHALVVSIANLILLAYLGYWGVIGLRTWS